MKGYKGFERGMVCRGKQYSVNTDFEEAGGEICGEGMMHFCKEPFDCLTYYPLLNDNAEFNDFAEVDALDEVVEKDDKCATKKLHVGAKLSFKEFVEAGVKALIEKTKGCKNLIDKGECNAQIGSSGDGAQIGSSGDWAQIGSFGDWARIGSSGYGARIGSSGDWAQIRMLGDRSVAACVGNGGMISGKVGDWIVLAEWTMVDGKRTPVCVKAGQIDGDALKADVAYKLVGGEFVEVDSEDY